MSNQPLERQEGANTSAHSHTAADALRSQWMDDPGTKIGIAINTRDGGKGTGVLEFNNPFDRVDPFKQSGFDESTGTFDKLWTGVKKFFGAEDKLDDQIKKYVEDKKLSPQEKDELNKERKLYEEEMAKVRASELQMNIAGKIYPTPDINTDPRFKEMKHLNDLVAAEEKSIQTAVEKNMAPLMPNVKKDMDRYNDSFKIHNPYGTGEGFGPHEQGPYLKVYMDQIKQETERRAHAGT